MANGPRIAGIEDVVGAPILAQAWMEPDNAFSNRLKMNLGGTALQTHVLIKHDEAAARAIETGEPPTGNVAMAATAGELVLMPAALGIVAPKVKGVWLRIPKDQIAFLGVTEGTVNQKVELRLADGNELRWTIHRARRKWVDAVVAALGR